MNRSDPNPDGFDPILTEILQARIREAAAAMEDALYRGAYTLILRESQDGSVAIADRNGRVILVAGGLRFHSLPFQQAIRSTLERHPDACRVPGNTFIVNDPYLGGNPHAPDMIAITPVHHDGALIAFALSLAHKADIGGLVPGSSSPDSREIYHDGLLLPPVLYHDNRGPQADIEAIVANNSRLPESVVGDLRAQAGATRIGAARLAALAHEHGVAPLAVAMSWYAERTASRLREVLSEWPDATAKDTVHIHEEIRGQPVEWHIRVRAAKTRDRLTLDFSGTSPQQSSPRNAPPDSVKAAALLALFATADPGITINSGAERVVSFVLPEGTLVNPRRPATVNSYFQVLRQVYAAVVSVLGQIAPEGAPALAGHTSGSIQFGYDEPRPGRDRVQYELLLCSLGGTPDGDGAAIVLPMNHFTANTPAEVLETEYPLRVRRFDIITDSAGAGTWRGGIGYVREYEILSPCTLTARILSRRTSPSGISGGVEPPNFPITVHRAEGSREELIDGATLRLAPGDRVVLPQGGGAGWGDPRMRDRRRVRNDIRDRYVSPGAARTVYGLDDAAPPGAPVSDGDGNASGLGSR